jgi:transcriptional regulator with XRE-family HTH domain
MNTNEDRKLVRRIRETAGCSLEDLAKRAKLSMSMLSKFELGHRDLSPEAHARLERAVMAAFHERSAEAAEAGGHTGVLSVIRATGHPECATALKEVCEQASKISEQRDHLVELLERFDDPFLREWREAETAAALAAEKARDLYERAKQQKLNRLSDEFTEPES